MNRMFTTTLLIMMKNWKQVICSIVDYLNYYKLLILNMPQLCKIM